MPGVTAVIPARNEEGAIGKVVAALPRAVVDAVVVVDNGSTDGTAAAARAAGARVVAEPRPGYGRACAAGVAAAGDAEVILFLDGDYSDFPEEAPLLLAPILDGRADLVIGSRLRGRRVRGALPLHQIFGNWLAARLMGALYGIQVTDLGPFRAIRGDLLRSLEMEQMTYGWPTEMMVKSARRGARIVEVPVSYRPRIGRSKISGTVRGTVLAAYCIFGVTLRYGWGRHRGGVQYPGATGDAGAQRGRGER